MLSQSSPCSPPSRGYKGPDRAPNGFQTIHALGSSKPLSSSAVPHVLCIGKKLHPLTASRSWAPVSCMDRSNPAPHSLHLLILLGKILLFLPLPSLRCPWGTAGCKLTLSERFGWSLFPAGSTARGRSRSPPVPSGCLCPLRCLPCPAVLQAMGTEVEQQGNKGAAGCRVWSQVLRPPGRTGNNEAFAASKKTPQSFQAAHGKSVKQLR